MKDATRAAGRATGTPGERRVLSFLIRLWQEPRETGSAPSPVRGYIRHLQSGEEHYFSDPEMIMEYVLRQLAEEDAACRPEEAGDSVG